MKVIMKIRESQGERPGLRSPLQYQVKHSAIRELSMMSFNRQETLMKTIDKTLWSHHLAPQSKKSSTRRIRQLPTES